MMDIHINIINKFRTIDIYFLEQKFNKLTGAMNRKDKTYCSKTIQNLIWRTRRFNEVISISFKLSLAN